MFQTIKHRHRPPSSSFLSPISNTFVGFSRFRDHHHGKFYSPPRNRRSEQKSRKIQRATFSFFFSHAARGSIRSRGNSRSTLVNVAKRSRTDPVCFPAGKTNRDTAIGRNKKDQRNVCPRCYSWTKLNLDRCKM